MYLEQCHQPFPSASVVSAVLTEVLFGNTICSTVNAEVSLLEPFGSRTQGPNHDHQQRSHHHHCHHNQRHHRLCAVRFDVMGMVTSNSSGRRRNSCSPPMQQQRQQQQEQSRGRGAGVNDADAEEHEEVLMRPTDRTPLVADAGEECTSSDTGHAYESPKVRQCLFCVI